MDLYDLQLGDRVRLADGTIAEVISATEDGRWIRVRHIESPNNPSRAGSEELCSEDEIEERVDVYSPTSELGQEHWWARPLKGSTPSGVQRATSCGRSNNASVCLLQKTNHKKVPAPNLRLTPENVEELQRLVEEERRLADAYRTAQIDERGRPTSDELGLRAREQAVADDDGMSQAD
jgi:hypothetical protein